MSAETVLINGDGGDHYTPTWPVPRVRASAVASS